MKQKTFGVVSGVVFSLVTALHVLRVLLGWEAVIGGWVVPVWFSWLAIPVAAFLAFTAFKLK